jgi:quinol monooxygenase YgiN
MTDIVKLVVHIRTQSGKANQQVQAFKELAGLVRAEAGCLQYDLHQVIGEPDQFLLFETWASQAALVTHQQSAHMRKAAIDNQQFRDGAATITFINEVMV